MRFWSNEECETAAAMLRALAPNGGRRGHAFVAIARALGRSEKAVMQRYALLGASFKHPEKRKHCRKLDGAQDIHAVMKFQIPARCLEERAHRIQLEPTSLTAAICGDPLPGYSALDRRNP